MQAKTAKLGVQPNRVLEVLEWIAAHFLGIAREHKNVEVAWTGQRQHMELRGLADRLRVQAGVRCPLCWHMYMDPDPPRLPVNPKKGHLVVDLERWARPAPQEIVVPSQAAKQRGAGCPRRVTGSAIGAKRTPAAVEIRARQARGPRETPTLGGSSATVGMAANPLGAHHVGRDTAG